MCLNYFRTTLVHWNKFENDRAEHILSCKYTVLCYILEYILYKKQRDAHILYLLSTCKY